MDRAVPFISRVTLRNYKSIAECDVSLGPLGPNGSGKSNSSRRSHCLAGLSARRRMRPSLNWVAWGRSCAGCRSQRSHSASMSRRRCPGGRSASSGLLPATGFEVGAARRRGLRPFEVPRETCELRWGGRAWRFGVERCQRPSWAKMVRSPSLACLRARRRRLRSRRQRIHPAMSRRAGRPPRTAICPTAGRLRPARRVPRPWRPRAHTLWRSITPVRAPGPSASSCWRPRRGR
jgi:hypothetical protein